MTTITPDLAKWRKSSWSNVEGSDCIELSPLGMVRDSKNPTGPALSLPWAGLVAKVKTGTLDLT